MPRKTATPASHRPRTVPADAQTSGWIVDGVGTASVATRLPLISEQVASITDHHDDLWKRSQRLRIRPFPP